MTGAGSEKVALLDRLARERLEAVAVEVRSEGWKWLEVAFDFPYGHTTGLRRVAPAAEAVSAADQASYDALRQEYDELEAEYEGAEELPRRRKGEGTAPLIRQESRERLAIRGSFKHVLFRDSAFARDRHPQRVVRLKNRLSFRRAVTMRSDSAISPSVSVQSPQLWVEGRGV